MAKLLLVDDDKDMVRSLSEWLRLEEHHTVEAVFNGKEAVEFIGAYEFDLIILDWEMPQKSGIDVCRYLREKGKNTPVIMLTGRSAVVEKTCGLDSGADDYLTKPFEPEELSARIRSLLRRRADTSPGIRHRDLELRSSSREVLVKNNPAKLAPADFDLLLFLIKSPGEAFSAEALLTRAWLELESPTIAGLRMSIRRIRKMLEAQSSDLKIETVGDGYRAL